MWGLNKTSSVFRVCKKTHALSQISSSPRRKITRGKECVGLKMLLTVSLAIGCVFKVWLYQTGPIASIAKCANYNSTVEYKRFSQDKKKCTGKRKIKQLFVCGTKDIMYLTLNQKVPAREYSPTAYMNNQRCLKYQNTFGVDQYFDDTDPDSLQ